MKKCILFALLLFNIQAYAQQTPDQLVAKFFQEYPQGAGKALENMYATNPWISRKADAIDQLKVELAKLTPDFVGRYYGYELIVQKRISSSFVLSSYLVRFDRQPIRFTFQFYKANDKWVIHSFKFDTNLDDELEESAKLNRLPADLK